MVNPEIFSGLISALTRGESLQRAMMTFYNAGYKKEEIEEAARALHSQVGQISVQKKVSPKQMSPQQIQKSKVMKTPQMISPQNLAQKPVQKTITKKTKSPQVVSSYGEISPKDSKQIKTKIDKAIHYLKQIEAPLETQPPKNKFMNKSPQNTQKVSDYSVVKPVKPFKKGTTILLIILLIILLGGLVTALFFREELINFFNSLNLG